MFLKTICRTENKNKIVLPHNMLIPVRKALVSQKSEHWHSVGMTEMKLCHLSQTTWPSFLSCHRIWPSREAAFTQEAEGGSRKYLNSDSDWLIMTQSESCVWLHLIGDIWFVDNRSVDTYYPVDRWHISRTGEFTTIYPSTWWHSRARTEEGCSKCNSLSHYQWRRVGCAWVTCYVYIELAKTQQS